MEKRWFSDGIFDRASFEECVVNFMNLLPMPMAWYEVASDGEEDEGTVRICGINDAFWSMVGMSGDEFGDQENRIGLVFASEKGKMTQAKELKDKCVLAARQRENATINHRFYLPGERSMDVTVNMGYMGEHNGHVYVAASFVDNTAALEKERELEKKAQTDVMTGLYNKTATEKMMKKQIDSKTSGSLCMIMIDVDNFKAVNDTFGHMFGDVVIRDIAKIIKKTLPRADVIGRIGGDEFLVLWADAENEEIEEALEKLCKKTSYEYLSDSGIIAITGSVGYCICNAVEAEYDTMFMHADTAMYFSKEHGKSRFARYQGNMGIVRDRGRRKKKKQEDIYSERDYDVEFVAKAYSLLAGSKYIESSIVMLFRKMTENYRLHGIRIFEYDRTTNRYYRSSGWSRNQNVDYSEEYLEYQKIMEQNQGEEYLEYEGGQKNPLLEQAYLFCRLPSQQDIPGYMCVTAREKERVWSDYEKRTFSQLAQVVSIFMELDRERRRENARIEEIITRDQVTGLLSMKSFEGSLSQYIKSGKKRKVSALFYFDIANFSYINEKYGYEVGDDILRTVAKNVCSGKTVCLAARAYSDCYLVLAENISKEAALLEHEYAVQNLIRVIRQKYPILDISVKAGVYFLEPEDTFAHVVIENANLARKKAKKEDGVRIIVFEERIRQEQEISKKITLEMQNAIRNEELKLYIQPKFSLETGEVIGLEAFGRWFTPQGLMRNSNEYVPVLAANGHLGEVDFTVLEMVLKSLQKWKKENRQLYRVSVNMSGLECCKEDFVKRVIQLTRLYGVEPHWIELEIASADMERYRDKIWDSIEQLRRYGFKIGVDNFGTGYEVLQMILEQRFDEIKVDRSFLAKKSDPEERKRYMRYLNELANTGEQQVLFIGAETAEQAKELKECGYRSVQGYYFERVISVEKFEEMYGKASIAKGAEIC